MKVDPDAITGGLEMTRSVENPKYAWRCELAPKIYRMFEDGNQPCLFHRGFQRIFFGLKWEKVDD